MRYAIYFAAEQTDPLMQLGNSWLGRDPFTGAALGQPAVAGISMDRLLALTGEPRRYGFHGTMKAPFSLHDGKSEQDLVAACEGFAADVSAFQIAGLNVSRLGRFLALTPIAEELELNALAAASIIAFEPFRAPLAQADLERRRRSNLTGRQDAYLTRWGYPYIFEEFRFHMTLSVSLESETEAASLEGAACKHFEPVTRKMMTCASIALYAEPERGAPFSALQVFPLTGSSSPSSLLAGLKEKT